MTLLDHPKLKVLSHANWTGIGAICGFIALPIALAMLLLVIYLQPTKRLEIREDSLIPLANVSQVDLKGDKPAHIYLITYTLLNTGNIPIAPKDFVDNPAIVTVTPSSISSITTCSLLHPVEERTASNWASTNKTDWTCRPFLLNPNQIMPIIVTLIPSSGDDNKKDYDPNDAIHWNIDAEGLTDIRYTKAPLQYAPLPTVLSITFLDRYDISFKGWSLWIFLALGIVSFVSVTGAWLRQCNNNYPHYYVLTLNIALLMFFSFALSEIIVCLFTTPIEKIAWITCPSIVVVYALYIFFLFHTKRATPSTPPTASPVSAPAATTISPIDTGALPFVIGISPVAYPIEGTPLKRCHSCGKVFEIANINAVTQPCAVDCPFCYTRQIYDPNISQS